MVTLNSLVFRLRASILDGDPDIIMKIKASILHGLSSTPEGYIHRAAEEAFAYMEAFADSTQLVGLTEEMALEKVNTFTAKWEKILGEKVTCTMEEVREYLGG